MYIYIISSDWADGYKVVLQGVWISLGEMQFPWFPPLPVYKGEVQRFRQLVSSPQRERSSRPVEKFNLN